MTPPICPVITPVLLLGLASLALPNSSQAESKTATQVTSIRPHVLLVGLDGVRLDALLSAKTPTIDSLRGAGAFSDNCRSVMPSSSGPGWATILSGQIPAVHGIHTNDVTKWKPEHATTLPSLLRQAGHKGRLSAVTHWEPLGQLLPGTDDNLNRDDDDDVESEALRLLEFEDPDFLFVHFDNADHMGHTFGFSPWMPTYRWALEGLDRRLARLCAALRSRPDFDAENWLVVVTSDHGGHGRHHGDDVETDRRIFLLLSGGAILPGSVLGETSLADVTPTILAHYEIQTPESHSFAGMVRGLSPVATEPGAPDVGAMAQIPTRPSMRLP